MKIAIVGANGQVGKELSCIFSRWGHDVTPIVRNAFAAAFFKLEGMPFVIGDVVSSGNVDRVLLDADVVVVAAVARGEFKMAAELNAKILSACVRKANPESVVCFFSSIRVLSRKIDRRLKWYEPLLDYDREKKASEAIFEKICGECGVRGRVLRLGHVVGPNQAKVKKFREALDESPKLAVNPNLPSNTVHTVTICDAILKAASESSEFAVWNLVNQPQWSWQKVFEAVNDGGIIEFCQEHSRKKTTSFARFARSALKLVRPAKKWIKGLKPYLGRRMGATVYLETRRGEVVKEMGELDGIPVSLSEFAYTEVPGPFLRNLEETEVLLERTPDFSY